MDQFSKLSKEYTNLQAQYEQAKDDLNLEPAQASIPVSQQTKVSVSFIIILHKPIATLAIYWVLVQNCQYGVNELCYSFFSVHQVNFSVPVEL